MTWEKVICPLGARLDTPVKISVQKEAKHSFLSLSFSALVVNKVGFRAGQQVTLYLDGASRQLRIVLEAGESSRLLRTVLRSHRVTVSFPHRPLSKMLPPKLLRTGAKIITAAKGELVIQLPNAVAVGKEIA